MYVSSIFMHDDYRGGSLLPEAALLQSAVYLPFDCHGTGGVSLLWYYLHTTVEPRLSEPHWAQRICHCSDN